MASRYLTNQFTNNSNLEGPFQGFSPQQTINNYKDSSQVMLRKVVTKSWNTAYASGKVNNNSRVITPFRAVNNSGDFLARQNYICGGPNQVNADYPGWKGHIGSIISSCDNTGVPSSTCNVKFVADSSDYTKFKRQRACVKNYNDLAFGGNKSHAEYANDLAIKRK